MLKTDQTEDERELLRLVEQYDDASHAYAVGLSDKSDWLAAKDAILAHYRKAKAEVHKDRLHALHQHLHNAVTAMRIWGGEGDGIPEDGFVGVAYDRACDLLRRIKIDGVDAFDPCDSVEKSHFAKEEDR